MTLLTLRRLGAATLAFALAMPAGLALAQTPQPYSDAVAARFPAPSVRYATPALVPGRVDFTRNEELAAFLEHLARAERVQLIEAGHSHAGVPILALHFSRGPGRPVAMLIGQQHGNEPAGAEALLALARALADEDSDLSPVLDRLDVIVLPRANPDGTSLGRRTTARGVDLNRDHLLLATDEARAIAQLALRFDPVLVVDAHEHVALSGRTPTGGGIARHDLLLQFATTPNLAPDLVDASEDWFAAPLRADLEATGLSSDWYHVRTAVPGRLAMGGIHPTLARNVFGLRHAVSVLLESRGLDLGRLHFERRVHSHVVAMSSLLRSAATHADALVTRRAAAVAAQRAMACSGPLVVEAAMTRMRREWQAIDRDTGADVSAQIEWDSALELRPLTTRRRPCGYWLAPTAHDAVARLRLLGVSVRQLDEPSRWRPRSTKNRPVARPPADGSTLRLSVELRARPLASQAGAYFVTMDQPLAALAAAALEPDSAHSYVAHRLLTLDQVARVLEWP